MHWRNMRAIELFRWNYKRYSTTMNSRAAIVVLVSDKFANSQQLQLSSINNSLIQSSPGLDDFKLNEIVATGTPLINNYPAEMSIKLAVDGQIWQEDLTRNPVKPPLINIDRYTKRRLHYIILSQPELPLFWHLIYRTEGYSILLSLLIRNDIICRLKQSGSVSLLLLPIKSAEQKRPLLNNKKPLLL